MDDTLPLSTHLVARLTRLLDLNSLEEIISLEECGYVKQNISIEQDNDFEYADIYDMEEPSKPSNQLTQLFRSLSVKLAGNTTSNFLIPKDKLDVMVQLIDYFKGTKSRG